MDAEAYAEANVNVFWRYVIASQDEDERRGLSRVLTVVDATAHVLKWYVVPNNADPRQRRKLGRLRHRPAFLNMIDSLTSREYEALGCVAMKAAGASEVSLTPAGNERRSGLLRLAADARQAPSVWWRHKPRPGYWPVQEIQPRRSGGQVEGIPDDS